MEMGFEGLDAHNLVLEAAREQVDEKLKREECDWVSHHFQHEQRHGHDHSKHHRRRRESLLASEADAAQERGCR
jgi:hypothetical protein